MSFQKMYGLYGLKHQIVGILGFLSVTNHIWTTQQICACIDGLILLLGQAGCLRVFNVMLEDICRIVNGPLKINTMRLNSKNLESIRVYMKVFSNEGQGSRADASGIKLRFSYLTITRVTEPGYLAARSSAALMSLVRSRQSLKMCHTLVTNAQQILPVEKF